MDRSRRGYVLIAVLASLTLAGVLAGSYALAARRGIQGARAEMDRARAQALARGGAIQAAKLVAVSIGNGKIAGAGSGSQNAPLQIPGLPAFPAEMASAGGFLGKIAQKMQDLEKRQAETQGRALDKRGAAPGTPGVGPDGKELKDGGLPPEAPPAPVLALNPISLTIDGAEVKIALECETGKIDLNRSPRVMIRNLLLALGEAETSADALLDSIEAYKISLSRAESSDRAFETLGFRERPLRGVPLRRLESILCVTGVTPELYERLVPHLTVLGSNSVDPSYATREVWKALGVRDDHAIDRLENERRTGARMTREALIGLLGASVYAAIEDHVSLAIRPVFTVRATAIAGGASGRHLIRIEIGEDRIPHALESREGWL